MKSLVIGGGPAGLQASLDLANAGYDVYLVEQCFSLGGRAVQIVKNYPSLTFIKDFMKPLMDDVYNHEKITVLTNSEVIGVDGEAGNFKVKVEKRPTYVNLEECKDESCAKAMDVCPVEVPNEFNVGLDKRKAIFAPFSYSVPSGCVIDEKSCLHFKDGSCSKCSEVCGGINFDEKKETVEIDDIGSIIVATGFDPFDPNLRPELAYDKYKNVITSLEFERMLDENGPTKGKIIVDGKEPKSIVFAHCIGSRDKKVDNPYCSRICCMYTAKEAYMAKEKIPDATIAVSYIDMRAFGKGYEQFYEEVQKKQVLYRRGVAAEIYGNGDKVVLRAEDTLLSEPYEFSADLIVLAVGVEPRSDSAKLANVLGLQLDDCGFFVEKNVYDTCETEKDGVFIAGCCQGPKDIPDSLMQGSAAAAKAIGLMQRCNT
ncbi:MAG TPA: CoB--CoM heterodisulfide reductase iron-sulfur subunit A family protein [Halobacteria archaeon]|jgi:heterodisulfide reductase subunit A|nr:CoB--CoM heterodisulfide reductase iron-sulfur subunit A family protein [Halobacteria archaeon]